MSSGERCLKTAGFYSQKNKRKWIGLENSINSVVKRHQDEKIPKSFPFRILGPSPTWQTFYRQKEAFQFCKSKSQDLHVFAFESESFEGNNGQRLYLAASYPVFWHYYSQLEEDKRLHYEVIPEDGSAVLHILATRGENGRTLKTGAVANGAVCKLYFDLEYDKSMNPGCDGNSMVDLLIKYFCLAVQSTFNLSCTRKDILDLDASTEKKFSRHLIFQMKNAAFKDNIHAGRFVCSTLSRLLRKIQTGEENMPDPIPMTDIHADGYHGDTTDTEASGDSLHQNMSNLNNCGSTSSIDHGFPNSPGCGFPIEKKHEAENDQAENYENRETGGKGREEEDNRQRNEADGFEKVFASFTLEDLQKLVVRSKNGDDILFCDTGVYTKNRNFRLFLSSKLGKNNPLVVAEQNEFCSRDASKRSKYENIFYDSLVANVQYCSGMKILTFDEGGLSSHIAGLTKRSKDKASQESECIDGYNKSPYPEVDEYISSIIARDSGKGVIRHWTYFHQGELLVYEIAKYRYCHNIGRHHRSNNIMLIADLQKGVWYQKCHDPDCHTQNYKSPDWKLPRDILPASYFDDDFDLEMDDDELLNTTVELEKQYMEQQANSAGLSEFDDGADDDLVAAVTELQDNTHLENG